MGAWIYKIYTGFEKNGLPIPTVSEHFGGVQIVIERTYFKELNKSVGNDVGIGVGNSTQKKIAQRYIAIKELIEGNPFITVIQPSEKLEVSDRTIERDIAKLQEAGILIREGDRNRGRWIVIK